MSTGSTTSSTPDPTTGPTTDRPRVVDAHQHFWIAAEAEMPWRQPGQERLASDHTPDDLRRAALPLGVTDSVLVQSEDGPAENDRLVRWSRQEPVAGVVGWLPLTDPGAARAEWRRLELPRLVGVRCLVGRDPLAWLERAEVTELFGELAVHDLSWDVVPLTREQCERVVRLCGVVPGLQVVVDHLARPPLDAAPGEDDAWRAWTSNLELLASAPGISIKLSVGLDVVSSWSWQPDQLDRAFGAALAAFGPERCMLASNWPVCELAADYATVWADQVAVVQRLLPAAVDRERVLGGTARDRYRLDRWSA